MGFENCITSVSVSQGKVFVWRNCVLEGRDDEARVLFFADVMSGSVGGKVCHTRAIRAVCTRALVSAQSMFDYISFLF